MNISARVTDERVLAVRFDADSVSVGHYENAERGAGGFEGGLIDLDSLALHLPEIFRYISAGERRLDQRATGYDATIVSGAAIRRFDAGTGARPGRLVRGGG